MLINKRTIHIEWGDCDPLGIVYFPRYFEFFDACTNALFEHAGFRKPDLLKKFAIAGIPLVEARAQFFAPSGFGDTVTVESAITEFGKSSFSVYHKLFRGDVLAAEGFEKRVWAVHATGEKKIEGQAIPREIIDKFTQP
ncbi:MAG: acyl-CoA thioesterase [Acidobacteriota bacterium]|nr:acyl-CoA thioesterase [Acidobacteriota bacterium]